MFILLKNHIKELMGRDVISYKYFLYNLIKHTHTLGYIQSHEESKVQDFLYLIVIFMFIVSALSRPKPFRYEPC